MKEGGCRSIKYLHCGSSPGFKAGHRSFMAGTGGMRRAPSSDLNLASLERGEKKGEVSEEAAKGGQEKAGGSQNRAATCRAAEFNAASSAFWARDQLEAGIPLPSFLWLFSATSREVLPGCPKLCRPDTCRFGRPRPHLGV